MKVARRSQDRGHANHGWLDSYHSFSFADYYDEDHVEFGPLRVLNEDRVAPGQGFGTHGHRNMEIISYVLDAELAHQDSIGTGSTIRPGDVQRMSAGSGIRHSEFNASRTNKVHFLQIWIHPNATDLPPSYEEKHFDAAEKRGRLRLIASLDGEAGSVRIHQDVRVYGGLFDAAERAELALAPGRRAYVHVARGNVHVNDVELNPGDALKVWDEAQLTIEHGAKAEILVFDLPSSSG
jgi:redox-sensitive bicupin YhaK (pirin superfamily)